MFNFKQFRNLLAKAGFDGFLLGLLGVIVIAYFLPGPGSMEGTFSLSNIAAVGISLIFFFYGLRLTPQKLRVGLSNWKLHAVIHISTFILFPLLILVGVYLFSNNNNHLIWLSVFFLATLPSTVSSAVVMVSIAGGNIPAAIFNASISSLLGVFITPLWMGFFLASGNGNMDLFNIIGKLILQVLLPVVMGILLNRYWGWFAEKHRKALRYFDQTIILLIVFTSFSKSFAHHMFAEYSATDLLFWGVSMLGLFLFMYILIHFISKIFRFNREDRITALFCGSKKSLMQGSVMAKVIFPNNAAAGVVLLSVMMYHAIQLITASIFAQSMAKSGKVSQTE